MKIINEYLEPTANFASTGNTKYTFAIPLPELPVGIQLITEQRLQQEYISLTTIIKR